MPISVSPASSGYWSPLDIASSATVTPSVQIVEKSSQSSVVNRNHNIRFARFSALQEALRSVTKLDEDDSFYLSPEVSARAADLLSVICTNLTIEPPKFLPQDGEVAVFTWETSLAKRFLSIDSNEVDLLDVNKQTFVKCAHDVPPQADEWTFIVRELGSGLNSSNASTDTYA